MASTTARVTNIRKRKKTKMGKARKKYIRKHGTTKSVDAIIDGAKASKMVS
jgi:hypothetical protein